MTTIIITQLTPSYYSSLDSWVTIRVSKLLQPQRMTPQHTQLTKSCSSKFSWTWEFQLLRRMMTKTTRPIMFQRCSSLIFQVTWTPMLSLCSLMNTWRRVWAISALRDSSNLSLKWKRLNPLNTFDMSLSDSSLFTGGGSPHLVIFFAWFYICR